MQICNTNRLLAAALLVSLPLSVSAGESAHDEPDQAAITQQLDRYEQALNASDVDAVMQLYAEDAVFMPQHSLPAVGRDAVGTAYRRVFDAIRLDIDSMAGGFLLLTAVGPGAISLDAMRRNA